MISVVDRFIRYVQINTQSNDTSDEVPSTPGQWDLARLLEREMRQVGLSDIVLSPHCYLYGKLPANSNREVSPIGFIAHLDTSPDESGVGVKPQFRRDENGDEIITSDGTTLLGADDKAGIAAIMSAIEYLIEHPEIEHGDVYVAFTPDEEIGRGTDFFDRELFKADFAYTIDGGEEGEIEIENFNAAKATITITGKPCHPGYAKYKMVNACLIASNIVEIIRSESTPADTEGYEGFFHITRMEGNIGHAEVELIIRDFDANELFFKKRFLGYLVEEINNEFGKNTAKMKIEDQYKNMFEIISHFPDIVSVAKDSMREVGVTPRLTPIRGGTDGVKLCFEGLPCPNLYAGGLNFHSKDEYIPVKSLKSATQTIVNIAKKVHERAICIKIETSE